MFAAPGAKAGRLLLASVAALALTPLAESALAANKPAPAVQAPAEPPPRPPPEPAVPAAEPSSPPPREAGEQKPLSASSGMNPPDFQACLADLRAAKIVFTPLDAAKDAGCEISGAVRLEAVATPFGDVVMADKPTMLCSFARQFSRWTREVAAPLTFADTGQRLAEIEASAFACRARYDKPGAIPSEHAKGNAIDLSSLSLADHRRVRVGAGQSDVARAADLVDALRTTACGYFTTVLGPGADAAHAEHLHFDLALHGASANYRICE